MFFEYCLRVYTFIYHIEIIKNWKVHPKEGLLGARYLIGVPGTIY